VKVLGIVPARGGSKGIPRKNLAPVAGRPLLAYTIEAALGSKRLSRVVVSTDDEEIAEVARALGAEVPFLRPAELAADDTPAVPVLQHAVRELEAEGWRADCIVCLQPTSPLRRAQHIDGAIDLLVREKADSVVSVIPVPHNFNPTSVLRLEAGCLVPFLPDQPEILRRQDKPVVYARNGPAVAAMTYETLMRHGRLYGERNLPFSMAPEDSLDVDTAEDLTRLEALLDRPPR
jgi:CMP-N,N'-diacetyllegionaminic acid synthase